MTRIMLSCALPCFLLLQACATDIDRDPHFGDAVRNNINAQIANPNAPSGAPMTAEGQRAAVAQGRYVTDRVKTPVGIDTKDNSGGGSSGSSGGNGNN
jgi:type IV pilus biogenesis protein CpaD/CtpE